MSAAALALAGVSIGAVIGLVIGGILASGKAEDAFTRGYAEGASTLKIGESDRVILTTPCDLTEEAAEIVIEQWNREGAGAVLLTGGIRIAAIERRPDVRAVDLRLYGGTE